MCEAAIPPFSQTSAGRRATGGGDDLQRGKTHGVAIREDGARCNRSDYDHFSLYGGTGGLSGRFDKVNSAELQVLSMGP